MKLFVTIYEETCEAAIAAIGALRDDHDGVEIRAERWPSIDLDALRRATAKPLLLTYRGSRVPDVHAALQAGIDLVDVEWQDGVTIDVPERTVLSHHDYEGMRDVEAIAAKMLARGCAYTKLAATPQNFADNQRLLALLLERRAPSPAENLAPKPAGEAPAAPTLSVIGMGERGLYTRILAPFRGSTLTFVAASNVAAPSQLALSRALEIYGNTREDLHAEKVFAVVGDPAGHSLSPSIHNRLFREKRVSAAYTIASIASFTEITEAFLAGEPCGLSVTAPFKDDAFAFAQRIGATIAPNAVEARAVNTLVNLGHEVVADNTDVDGFAALLPNAQHAAIIGAGGTARAARVALQRAGIRATVYNRTVEKADAPLDVLAQFDGDLVINTLPSGVAVELPRCTTYIEAAYAAEPRRVDAQQRIDGRALLDAQAVRQHELFMRIFR
ncbi:MAG TPA: type I 3-dehydroquinate dehydratase [Thermoanaerobaculia bacterium]|nr:type I 3-dehydroquinate dehydratase [Thermoanaerobaculia bacterium]